MSSILTEYAALGRPIGLTIPADDELIINDPDGFTRDLPRLRTGADLHRFLDSEPGAIPEIAPTRTSLGSGRRIVESIVRDLRAANACRA